MTLVYTYRRLKVTLSTSPLEICPKIPALLTLGVAAMATTNVKGVLEVPPMMPVHTSTFLLAKTLNESSFDASSKS